MTVAEFIKRVRMAVYESSVEGMQTLLEKPPGRQPSPRLVALSQWYNQLDANERRRVDEVVQLSIRSAVVGMLTVLDGATSIRETMEEQGVLELRYTSRAQSVLLNDPSGEQLHDLFAEEVPPA